MANLDPELTEKLCQLFADPSSNWDKVLISLVSNDNANLHLVEEVVKQLSKSQINECDDKGRTALAIAAANRGRELVVSLLLDHHASVDIRDEDGYYPIHHAASAGIRINIGFLLVHGAVSRLKRNPAELRYILHVQTAMSMLLASYYTAALK